MSDALDDRRRALEEEYFRRKDRESLEKLREALKQEAQEKGGAEAQHLSCPRCGSELAETDCEGVEVDHCERCGGVWLDAGEVEQLLKREQTGWLGRMWQGFSGKG